MTTTATRTGDRITIELDHGDAVAIHYALVDRVATLEREAAQLTSEAQDLRQLASKRTRGVKALETAAGDLDEESAAALRERTLVTALASAIDSALCGARSG